jgi:hypothetical protein
VGRAVSVDVAIGDGVGVAGVADGDEMEGVGERTTTAVEALGDATGRLGSGTVSFGATAAVGRISSEPTTMTTRTATPAANMLVASPCFFAAAHSRRPESDNRSNMRMRRSTERVVAKSH